MKTGENRQHLPFKSISIVVDRGITEIVTSSKVHSNLDLKLCSNRNKNKSNIADVCPFPTAWLKGANILEFTMDLEVHSYEVHLKPYIHNLK